MAGRVAGGRDYLNGYFSQIDNLAAAKCSFGSAGLETEMFHDLLARTGSIAPVRIPPVHEYVQIGQWRDLDFRDA